MNQLEELNEPQMELKIRSLADQLILYHPTPQAFNELYSYGRKIVKKHRQRLRSYRIYVSDVATFEIIYDSKMFHPGLYLALKNNKNREIESRIELYLRGFNFEYFQYLSPEKLVVIPKPQLHATTYRFDKKLEKFLTF